MKISRLAMAFAVTALTGLFSPTGGTRSKQRAG